MKNFKEFKSEQQYVTEIGPIAATLMGAMALWGSYKAFKKVKEKIKGYITDVSQYFFEDDDEPRSAAGAFFKGVLNPDSEEAEKVDKIFNSFDTYWNSFKEITKSYSENDKQIDIKTYDKIIDEIIKKPGSRHSDRSSGEDYGYEPSLVHDEEGNEYTPEELKEKND